MGLYTLKCKSCFMSFVWFSGATPSEYCPDCMIQLHKLENETRHVKCDTSCELCKAYKEKQSEKEIEEAALASAANMGPSSPNQIFIEGFTLTQIIEAGLKALKGKS